jgi:hypothetical protein
MTHDRNGHPESSLTALAVRATLHCLTGCAAGEILGMIMATALGLGNAATIAISILLAFLFGYGLTVRPVVRAGVPFRRAVGLAFASDTVSITTMELVDNAFILLVPGAFAAGLADGLFWWSLLVSLVIAFALTVPVNRRLIGRGRGHAIVHELHAHERGETGTGRERRVPAALRWGDEGGRTGGFAVAVSRPGWRLRRPVGAVPTCRA